MWGEPGAEEKGKKGFSLHTGRGSRSFSAGLSWPGSLAGAGGGSSEPGALDWPCRERSLSGTASPILYPPRASPEPPGSMLGVGVHVTPASLGSALAQAGTCMRSCPRSRSGLLPELSPYCHLSAPLSAVVGKPWLGVMGRGTVAGGPGTPRPS